MKIKDLIISALLASALLAASPRNVPMSYTYAGVATNYPVNITLPQGSDLKDVSTVDVPFEGLADRTAYLAARQVNGDKYNGIFDQPGGSPETATQLFGPGASDSGRITVPYSGGGDFAIDYADVTTQDAFVVDVDGTVVVEANDRGYIVLVSSFDGNTTDEVVQHFKSTAAAQIYIPFHIHKVVACSTPGAASFLLVMRHVAGGASAFALLGRLEMSALQIKVT